MKDENSENKENAFVRTGKKMQFLNYIAYGIIIVSVLIAIFT